MLKQQQLLGLLADGQLHSGTELATELGISRAAVWKNVRQLETLGIEVEAQAGQGYRLRGALELLQRESIMAALPTAQLAAIDEFDLLWVTESTSDYLLQGRTPRGRARICLAEFQSGGRGRRGRQWLMPAGHGVCASVGWCFPSAPASLSCLGLAVGVGVLRAVRRWGLADVQLKWPNDVVCDGRKLAGILIDVHGETGGPLQIVAGVGLNYSLTPATAAAIVAAGGLPPTSLMEQSGSAAGGRNRAAAILLSELIRVLEEFERSGFASLAAEWLAADHLHGKAVKVTTESMEIIGQACGISADGQLRVTVDGVVQHLLTGDVSVRTTP